MKARDLTLCIIPRGNSILLGLKKRGFGKGNWNGFGGKVHKGETIQQAAVRECKEEAGIDVRALESRGTLLFTFEDDDSALIVHLFAVTSFSGTPEETEEMKPQWFSFNRIPYTHMWPDDIHWLPKVLSGKRVNGRFHLRDHENLLQFDVQDV